MMKNLIIFRIFHSPILTLNNYLKDKYNEKVFKVSLNGNFSCPNRDGKISTKGCLFCSANGSGDFAGV